MFFLPSHAREIIEGTEGTKGTIDLLILILEVPSTIKGTLGTLCFPLESLSFIFSLLQVEGLFKDGKNPNLISCYLFLDNPPVSLASIQEAFLLH